MFPVPTKTWNWNCEKKPKFQIGSFCQMEQSQFQRKQGGANAFSESLDIFLILPFSSASNSSPLHVLLFVVVLGGNVNVIQMSLMSVLFFAIALIRHILASQRWLTPPSLHNQHFLNLHEYGFQAPHEDVAFSDVSFQPKILNVFETSGQETLFVSNANPLCFVFTPGVSLLVHQGPYFARTFNGFKMNF